MGDLVGSIMAYEADELDANEVLDLFADLIASGTVWSLQGSYGRQAMNFIEAGMISYEGEINWDRVEECLTY